MSAWLGQVRWLSATEHIGHGVARAMILKAFQEVFGRLPTQREAMFAQAVSLCETVYGQAWKDAGVGSNNMGAIQAGRPPCNPETSFPYGDTHEDGTPYAACFRKYATPEAGFKHFIEVLYKQRPSLLKVAATASVRQFSTTMRASGYFELGLEKHIKALTKCLQTIAKAMNEPMPPVGAVSVSSPRSGGWVVPAAIAAAGVAGFFFLRK